jgi:uncharacterized protein YjbI with pentapeptide repeats
VAKEELLAKLRQDADAWNAWRDENPDVSVDLRNAQLSKTDLSGRNLSGVDLAGAVLYKARLPKANLSRADLKGARLSRAILRETNLSMTDLSVADLAMADLRKANLSNTKLTRASLRGAKLAKADLRGADLSRADLLGVSFFEANFQGAIFSETVLADTSLMGALGLEVCNHRGPSTIDQRTLQRSGMLPVGFLRGCGLTDNFIEQLPELLNQPAEFLSCFISYSSVDEEFASRLYADLQNAGVRCWFAPRDMKIGAKILDTLDQAIRLRDRVLLVLSRHAINSEWVEDEVTKAFAEERKRPDTLLVPIRIDDFVMETNEAWAVKLRDSRHIGDFEHWRDHDAYQQNFEKLLRDLRMEQADKPTDNRLGRH